MTSVFWCLKYTQFFLRDLILFPDIKTSRKIHGGLFGMAHKGQNDLSNITQMLEKR